MTTATLNSLERCRLEIGLTDPQMLRALGAKKGRATLLTAEDRDIDPVFHSRARELIEAYHRWTAGLKQRIHEIAEVMPEISPGVRALTAVQVARVVGISEFNFAKMAERGLVDSVVSVRRVYPEQAVIDFIDGNSSHLSNDSKRSRAPLATPFLEWFEKATETP